MAWNRRSTTFPIHFTITCVDKRSTNFTTTFSDRLIMHWTVWEVSVHAQEFLWSASRSAQQIIESKTQREIYWESQGVIIPGFFCPCSATNCGFWHCSNGCFLSHGGTPKSSILIGLSIINHPFLGYRLFLITSKSECALWPVSRGDRRARIPPQFISTVAQTGGGTSKSGTPIPFVSPLKTTHFGWWDLPF